MKSPLAVSTLGPKFVLKVHKIRFGKLLTCSDSFKNYALQISHS